MTASFLTATIHAGSARATGRQPARALSDELQQCVLRAVVDTRLNTPTMVEVTFDDHAADVLDRSGIDYGSRLEVWAIDQDGGGPVLVGGGQVTAIEGDYYNAKMFTVVRAYDATHLLQRRSRSRPFVGTDSDIARQIAADAGLAVGGIVATSTAHSHLAQMNQTDWEFLTWRCREIGYEFGIEDDRFYFRPLGSASAKPVELDFRTNLRTFRPRVTAGNAVPEVELRAWDPMSARTVSTLARTRSSTAELDDIGISDVIGWVDTISPPAGPSTSGSGSAENSRGPAPTRDGRILTSTLPAVGAALGNASREALQGPAARIAGSVAEAQGLADGDPRVRTGIRVRVTGVPKPFTGTWAVAAARHVFDVMDGGYRTHLQLGNPENRTLLGLTAADSAGPPATPRVQGLASGVVSDVNDPAGKGRVKVALAWLHPDYVTDWAPVIQAAGGQRAGALLLPEVGDQVLLGFELGDPRRPYVVGGVLSNVSAYALGGPAVEAEGHIGAVVRRGIVSPSGNMLAFYDKMPSTKGQPPRDSEIHLGTKDDSLALVIDQVHGTVRLVCRPPEANGTGPRLDIDCGESKGTVNITAGADGNVNITGGSLNMRAETSLSIESKGTVAIKGAEVAVTGKPIKLN
ncbi:hypothetical protein GTY41_07265 [Streptomyces sp. SID685]|uniref:phage baseplate assembly protein V n=1 Tax=Streptomyces sp. SID685 TaxID=2690322 RepID=UPI001367DEFB|nr:phage baseplate assembly protein V [Streptomyces sp. SID685]MYR84756.1 hypothetical protein [Streptomyces sp. SID685]